MAEKTLNFQDTASVTWAIVDDPPNSRYDISANAVLPPAAPLPYVTVESNSLVIPSGALKQPDYTACTVSTNDVTGSHQTFGPNGSFNGSNFMIDTTTFPHLISILQPGVYAGTVSFDVQLTAGPLPALFGVEMNMTGSLGSNSMSAMIGNGITTPSATCTSVHVFGAPIQFVTSVLQYSGVNWTSATIRTQLVRLGDYS